MSEKIIESLRRIEKRLEEIDRKCEDVTAHANFVESVYETIRSPLDFITGYVSRYMPTAIEDSGRSPLPSLKSKSS
mgnify:CR=1 FL=1|tara:strand:- start:2824 stop:3051 length:228 start_codon:yes stop_codon:yes gene_type:complete